MRKQTDILRIMIMAMAGLIVLFLIVGSVILFSASKKLKAIVLSPDFIENELEVGRQYSFTINTKPSKASTKKIQCVIDDPMSTFEVSSDGKAVLTTGLNEGTVTVYVECKDIKSQVLTFNVVDIAAREAAAAEAEAQAAAAEAEAAQALETEAEVMENVKQYVKCKGDDVRVRSSNNVDTNDNILGKAGKGDVFEKVEDVDDWTHIIYKGQDGYMKTEFLETISEEEAMTAADSTSEEAEAEEPKKEEKKQETTEENTAAQETTATQTKEEAEAKAAADAAAAAAQAELEAAAAAAAAQAAAAAAGTVIHCKDGDCLATPAQVEKIHATWDFAGDAIEMAGHHSVSELEAVIGSVTRL